MSIYVHVHVRTRIYVANNSSVPLCCDDRYDHRSTGSSPGMYKCTCVISAVHTYVDTYT